MRVLLDCRMVSWSGVGRYTTGLARALAARDDVELVQVCPPGVPAPVQDSPRCEVVTAAAHPFGVRGARELGRLVDDAQPDLVHCAHFPTPAPSRRPLVVTLHDLTPLVVTGVMPSALKRIVYRGWNARATRLADVVLVPSRSTAADVARLFPRVGNKLRVIPEAADDFSNGSATILTGTVAVTATPPYLFSMGNTKPHKDLPALLYAFQRVAASRPDLRLVLAGVEPTGYLREHLKEAEPAVRARVAFSGRVADEELRSLYAGATAFVFPSRYEGFGLPVLEAMALGAPVVCTNAASLPEVTGDAALLVPAGDPDALAHAIERSLDDDSLRTNLVAAGRAQAARFSWERTAAETVGTYAEALARRGASPGGREEDDP